MKKSIGNFMLEGWTPTPVEQALYDGTFDSLFSGDDEALYDDIPEDFLIVYDFERLWRR